MRDIEYYTQQTKRSAISKDFADKFDNTPDEIMKKVRSLIVHPCECPYNFTAKNWPYFTSAACIEKQLKQQDIIFAKCREYSLLSVSVMREKGVPARCRCGFASYFSSGFYEDHWIIEYYDEQWKMADAQTLRLDIKTGEFINGALAWKLIRKADFDERLFGFSGLKEFQTSGLTYVISNMIRDASGLLKDELDYPEKVSSLMNENHALSQNDYKILDELSDLILKEEISALKTAFSALKKI